MSHFFFRGRPLTTATLAVATLSRRMVQRSAAAPLVACRGPTQLLTPTHLLAVPWAIRLSALTPAADPNGDPAAPAVVPPIRSHPHAPRAQRWTAPGGSRHIEPAAKPPQAHRIAGGPGSSGIGARALAFYLAASITNAPAPPAIGGGRSATSFRERSARRRQTRSAAARPQDAAVYGRRSRPPTGTLMNLSMRPPLRATASPGTPRPNPPSNTSSAPTTRNVQVVYFWQAGPGSFWIALQLLTPERVRSVERRLDNVAI